MPYIKKETRSVVDENLSRLSDSIVEAADFNISALPGVLNYCITRIIKSCYKTTKNAPLSYSDYNAAIGMLECAKLELYRRIVASYEDEKIKENGDV